MAGGASPRLQGRLRGEKKAEIQFGGGLFAGA
jgi:hypothetical protein